MTRRGRIVAVLLTLALAAGCGPKSDSGLTGVVPRGTSNTATLTLPEVSPAGVVAPFALKPPPGGLLIVFFGYVSCPDVCPTTLSDIRAALQPLGGEVARCEVAFVTVDMARDTAAVLAPYLASFVPGGHALRPASQDQLAAAERAFGATSTVTRGVDGKIEVTHSGLTYVVDDTGRIRVAWGFGTKPDVMTHDLRILLTAPTAVR